MQASVCQGVSGIHGRLVATIGRDAPTSSLHDDACATKPGFVKDRFGPPERRTFHR